MGTNKRELAWAAGFFDGEGCVYVRSANKGHHHYLRVAISQTNLEILERFRAAVGVGNIHGPYKGRKPHHQDVFRYAAGHDDTYIIYEKLKFDLSSPKLNQFNMKFGEVNSYRY